MIDKATNMARKWVRKFADDDTSIDIDNLAQAAIVDWQERYHWRPGETARCWFRLKVLCRRAVRSERRRRKQERQAVIANKLGLREYDVQPAELSAASALVETVLDISADGLPECNLREVRFYLELRASGQSQQHSAECCGITDRTARNWESAIRSACLRDAIVGELS